MLFITSKQDETMIRKVYAFETYFKAFERFIDRKSLKNVYVTEHTFENHASEFDAGFLLTLPFWLSCVYPGDTNYRIALIKRYYCRIVKEQNAKS